MSERRESALTRFLRNLEEFLVQIGENIHTQIEIQPNVSTFLIFYPLLKDLFITQHRIKVTSLESQKCQIPVQFVSLGRLRTLVSID